MIPPPSRLGPFIGTSTVAGFAVLWVMAGARSLESRWWGSLSLLALLISAGVIWREYDCLRAGTHGILHFDGAAYGIAVMFESIAIPVTAALLKRGGKETYLLPAIAFIVGLHFFGLVWAFDSPGCWWIGGAMCLLPIVAVGCLPAGPRRTDGGETRWRDVAVGLGCAAILWIAVLTLF